MSFIFDFDGTVVRNRAFRYAIEIVPRVLNLGLDPDVFYRLFLETYYGLVASGQTKKAFDWDFVCELTVRRLGFDYRRGLFRDLMLEGIHKGLVEIINYADEALRELKDSGFILGLLTNGYSWYQKPALKVSGLDRFFDFAVFLDYLKEPKPSTLAFLYAKRLAGNRRTIYFVGDHPYYDIYGALKIDFDGVFWVTKEVPSGVYRVIDLKDIIAEKAKKYGKSLDLSPIANKEVIVIDSLRRLFDYVIKNRNSESRSLHGYI